MQRRQLESTLSHCPRYPFPCGVAARFRGYACCSLTSCLTKPLATEAKD